MGYSACACSAEVVANFEVRVHYTKQEGVNV